jgi:hypothetical protein
VNEKSHLRQKDSDLNSRHLHGDGGHEVVS